MDDMDWKLTENFTRGEFTCFCCGASQISMELVERLQKARNIAGIPFIISSGVRCERHNEAVGGEPNSSHLRGLAADIATNYTAKSRQRYVILDALLEAGFCRIGISERFIHVDIDMNKSQDVLWL